MHSDVSAPAVPLLFSQRLLDRPFSKAKSHPAALKQGKYALSAWESLKVVTKRQALLTIKDSGLIRGRLVQVRLV